MKGKTPAQMVSGIINLLPTFLIGIKTQGRIKNLPVTIEGLMKGE
jgi:hypothetical protein